MTVTYYDVYAECDSLSSIGTFLGTAVYDQSENTLTALTAEPRRQGVPALTGLSQAAQAALLEHLQRTINTARGQRHLSAIFLMPSGERRSSEASTVYDLLNDDGVVHRAKSVNEVAAELSTYLTERVAEDCDKVHISKVKRQLRLHGLHSIAWTRARDEAVSRLPDWDRVDRHFVRVPQASA